MIPDLEDYIETHISPEPETLKRIDRETNIRHLNGRMCSGHIQGRILKMITAMINPKRVLELGTFTGYSALCVAEALEEGAEIITVEADDELEEEIRRNLDDSPHGKKVKLIIGDALRVMESLPADSFDMILIDADKRQYPSYFKSVLPLVKTGGFILADNTLWDGHVTEKENMSPQTLGIMNFNDLVASDPCVETAILPVRDGLTIMRKIGHTG